MTRVRVPETLPEEVLKMMNAPPKPEDIPVLQDPAKLAEYDVRLRAAFNIRH